MTQPGPASALGRRPSVAGSPPRREKWPRTRCLLSRSPIHAGPCSSSILTHGAASKGGRPPFAARATGPFLQNRPDQLDVGDSLELFERVILGDARRHHEDKPFRRIPVRLRRPGASVAGEPLLEVLRSLPEAHAEPADAHGWRRVVRNGQAPACKIRRGIGPISVRRRSCATAATVPAAGVAASPHRCCRRSRGGRKTSRSCCPLQRLLALSPSDQGPAGLSWLYLDSVSTGHCEEAPAALLGPAAPRLSAATCAAPPQSPYRGSLDTDRRRAY